MKLPITTIKIKNKHLTAYKIIPDANLDNSGLIDFIKLIDGLYMRPIDKVQFMDNHIEFFKNKRLVWEIHLTAEKTEFIVLVPTANEVTLTNRLGSALSGSALQKLDSEYTKHTFTPNQAIIHDLKYSEHFSYSISTDLNNDSHLKHLLNTASSMSDGEKLIVQVIVSPTSQDWKEQLLDEAKPKVNISQELVSEIDNLIGDTIEQVFDDNGFRKPKNFAPRKYGTYNRSKIYSVGFNVNIRIAAISPRVSRRNDLMLAACSAMRALDGKNSLVKNRKQCKYDLFIERKPDTVKNLMDYLRSDQMIMTAEEITQIIQLPKGKLLAQINTIEAIRIREVDIPEKLLEPGIPIGIATKKTINYPVNFPVSDIDALCLPRIVIGGMGSGKSSYASNFAVEAFRLNYNVVAFDVADGRMVRQIRDSIEPHEKHRVKHLDIGNFDFPIALVWNEATLTPNRMASEFIKFIELITGELGVRTRRYMKKAFLAVFEDKSSTILDALHMLIEDDYRAKKIPQIKDKEVKQFWIDFELLTEKDKNEILSPVMNRLDYLLDDDGLRDRLCRKPKMNGDEFVIDFKKWLNQDFSKPYESNLILITIPKIRFGSYALDILVAFLVNKIWLTLQSRNPVTVLKTGVPTFVLMDEPHQFMRSAELWREMVVETRKWRGAMIWFFHTWEQIRSRNPSLAKEIKSAGVHYVLFRSDKNTWRDLAEEIAPFTMTEALEIPAYHAIVKCSETPPVMCAMINTIDKRLPVYDNYDITYTSARTYGIDKLAASPDPPKPLDNGSAVITSSPLSLSLNFKIDPSIPEETPTNDHKPPSITVVKPQPLGQQIKL